MRKKTTTTPKADKIDCPVCTGPMVEISKRYYMPDPGNGHKCRIRKFKCDLCDHEETIFGNGQKDLNPDQEE